MTEVTDPEKMLFHYTNRAKGEEIIRTGEIKPSKPRTYLSVNENGDFDSTLPTGPPGKGWISGTSEIPNIFLTDTPPDQIGKKPFGVGPNYCDYSFPITVGEILNQGLRIYKNPSREYPNIYNVPSPDRRGLKVDVTKILEIAKF